VKQGSIGCSCFRPEFMLKNFGLNSFGRFNFFRCVQIKPPQMFTLPARAISRTLKVILPLRKFIFFFCFCFPRPKRLGNKKKILKNFDFLKNEKTILNFLVGFSLNAGPEAFKENPTQKFKISFSFFKHQNSSKFFCLPDVSAYGAGRLLIFTIQKQKNKKSRKIKKKKN